MRAFLSCVLLLAAPLSAQGPVDLSALLAPATPSEIASTRAAWSARSTAPSNAVIVATTMQDGLSVAVLRFELDGTVQYAALRRPEGWPALAAGSRPLVVRLHGGEGGTSLNALSGLDALVPSPCLRQAFVLAPTFRGEPLNAGGLGTFASTGAKAADERDADDALAAIEAVRALEPALDGARVGLYGSSRGGYAALLVAVREPRVRTTIDAFGASTPFLPVVRTGLERRLQGLSSGSPYTDRLYDAAIAPLAAGAIAASEARRRLLFHSVIEHLEGVAPLLALHGSADPTIPVEHSRALDAAARALPSGAPACWRYEEYAGGVHSLASLPGASALVGERLCAFVAAATACGAPTCGFASYRENAAPANDLVLEGVGSPVLGALLRFRVRSTPGHGTFVAVAAARGELALFDGALLVDPLLLFGVFQATERSGQAALGLPVPALPELAGFRFANQALAIDPAQLFGVAFSNGLEVVLCP